MKLSDDAPHSEGLVVDGSVDDDEVDVIVGDDRGVPHRIFCDKGDLADTFSWSFNTYRFTLKRTFGSSIYLFIYLSKQYEI